MARPRKAATIRRELEELQKTSSTHSVEDMNRTSALRAELKGAIQRERERDQQDWTAVRATSSVPEPRESNVIPASDRIEVFIRSPLFSTSSAAAALGGIGDRFRKGEAFPGNSTSVIVEFVADGYRFTVAIDPIEEVKA